MLTAKKKKKDPRSKDDRKRWDRAVEIFTEQRGHGPKGDDYALVQHIFQGMKRTKHVPGKPRREAGDLVSATLKLAASKPVGDPFRVALLAALVG